MNWSFYDYLIVGGMLASLAFIITLAVKLPGGLFYKVGLILSGLTAILLFWVNGAVGLIGSAGNDANMLYNAMLLAGFAGAALSRLRAKGMAWTMAVMAAAQILIPPAALALWPVEEPLKVLGVTVLFTGLWGVSTGLFSKAAR